MRHLTVGLCKWALQKDRPGDDARDLEARPGWRSFPGGRAPENGLSLRRGDTVHTCTGGPGPPRAATPLWGRRGSRRGKCFSRSPCKYWQRSLGLPGEQK